MDIIGLLDKIAWLIDRLFLSDEMDSDGTWKMVNSYSQKKIGMKMREV